jgi:teichuronic acid biosynthesis glycosyltransferase TuaC
MTVKILFVSNLFPDSHQPIFGLDNARLLHHLAGRCDIRVVAPRPAPWLLPFLKSRSVQPRREDQIFQPIYPLASYIPKIGSRWNHRLMAGSLRPVLQQVRHEFPFDAVLVSWLYPDGCAVAELATSEKFPFVAIAQGSDAHQYLKIPARRHAIVTAMNRACAVVARSREITLNLSAAGVAASKLHAIYNGVNFALYRPADKRSARKELGLPLEDPVILYVGNFFPIKNPFLAVAAHDQLSQSSAPTAQLVMLGDGPLLKPARQQADRSRSGTRVQLPGRRRPAQVARYMQAADVLCVPSHNEGVPNVVLEAFACGLPVVATRVGGIPEVLCCEFLGRLVEPANVTALTTALAEMLTQSADLERIVQHAQQFSWEHTVQAHFDLLQKTR